MRVNGWLKSWQNKQSPVYWQETIENMKADGINTFIEIGPVKLYLV